MAETARFARLASALGGTHPGTETVPPDCFYAAHCPFRISHYIKSRHTRVHLLFYGGDGEIRTRGGLLPN